MKKNLLFSILVILLSFLCVRLSAQVSISSDNSNPDPSAMLDVKSTSKGFLPPRMTYSQLLSITSPAEGLLVYCLDCLPGSPGVIAMFSQGKWYTLNSSCLLPLQPVAGTHVAGMYQVTWNWNSATGASAYLWNTVNDLNSATNIGLVTSKTETSLTCNTSYTRYVWASNSCGVSSAVTLSKSTLACPWTCGQLFLDSRDNRNYPTVLVGSQCWFARNLNVGTRINSSVAQTNNGVIEKYCYNDTLNYCSIYGGLYQFDEMMQYSGVKKGICPEGWHVPDIGEWSTLVSYLGGPTVAGGKMKDVATNLWLEPNTGATNSSGLTVLPAGFYDPENLTFRDLTMRALYYYSDYYGGQSTGFYSLFYDDAGVFMTNTLKTYGFSVRCVKD